MVGLLSCLCFSNIANAQTYDGVNSPWTGTSGECGVACGQTDLIDIRNMTGATQFNISDDSFANFNLPWEAEMIDGHKVSQGKMYMNGFISFSDTNVLYGGCCDGFRLDEDPLNPPSYWNNWNETMLDYMIAPLWTDLIRGSGSTWYYADDDEAVFGWYEVKEYGQNNTKNTFEIQMNPDGWTFAYDRIEIKNHSIWAGATGDLSEGHVEHLFFHNKGDGDYIWQWDETSNNSYAFLGDVDTIDCSNPLNDASCPGYAEAYLAQQCAIDALYDSQCTGYAQAYLDQQCGIDPLYDSTCTGYDEAYLAQQCTLDPLYDTSCQGYDLAFFDELCEIDPQSDEGCDGFVWSFDEGFDPLDEFIPEGVSFGDEEEYFGYEEEEFYGYEEMPMDGSVEEYEDIVFFEPFEEESFTFEPLRDEYFQEELSLFELEEVAFIEVSEEEFFEILEEEGIEPEEIFVEEEFEDFFRETPLLVEVDEEVVEVLLLEEEILEEIEEIVEEEFIEEEIEEIFEEELIVEAEELDEIEPAPVRVRGERKESKAKKESRKETAKAVNSAINSAMASGNSVGASGSGSGGSSGGSAFSGSNSAFSGGLSGGGFASSTGDVFLDDIQNFGSITGNASVQLGELETSNSQAMSSQAQQQDDLTGGVDTGVDIPVLSFNLPEIKIDIPDDNRPKTLAEVLAERVAERKEKNQTGVFANQVTILQGMAKATDLSMYYADTYTFESDWYKTESIYKSAKMNDAQSLFRMTNESHGKMRELIRSQY